MGKQQSIDPIKGIYTDLGLEKAGVDYDTFNKTFRENSEARKSIYSDLGLESAGVDYDTFETKLGLKKKASTQGSANTSTTFTKPLQPSPKSIDISNPFGGQSQAEFIGQETAQRIQKQSAKTPVKKQPVAQEEDSFLDNLGQSFKAGLGQLGQIVSSLPSGALDTYGKVTPQSQGLVGGLGILTDWIKDIKTTSDDNLATQYLSKMIGGAKEVKNAKMSDIDSEELGQITQKYLGIPEELNPYSPNNMAANYFKEVRKKNHDLAHKNYKGGIWQAIEDGKYKEAGKLTALGAVESLPLMLGMIASRGAGMTGNQTLGAMGIGTAEQEYADLKEANPNIDKNLLLLNAQLTGVGEAGSELVGTNLLYDTARNLFRRGATQEAQDLVKKGIGAYLSNMFKKSFVGSATLADAAGEGVNQVWKNAADKWTGVDPNRDYTDGVMDAMIISMASTGGLAMATKGASSMINKKNKQEFVSFEQELETINNDLANPNLPPAVRETLERRSAELTEGLNDIIEKETKSLENLTPEQLQEVETINTSIESLEQSLQSENLSPQSKTAIEQEKKELEKQLSEIKPTEEVVVEETITPDNIEQTEEYKALTARLDRMSETLQKNGMTAEQADMLAIESLTPAESKLLTQAREQSKTAPKTTVTETIDVTPSETTTSETVNIPVTKASDAFVGDELELIDGKKGTVIQIDGDNITMKLDNGATFTANPKMVELFKNEIKTSKEVVAETEVITPIEEVDTLESIEESRQKELEEVDILKPLKFGITDAEYKEELANYHKRVADETKAINDKYDQKIKLLSQSKPLPNENKQANTEIKNVEEASVQNPPAQTTETGGKESITETKTTNEKSEGETNVPTEKTDGETAKPKRKSEEIAERRQAVKDRIREKFKAQRGNLSSGFDPSMIKDFIELGVTYIEDGVVTAKEFIKRFRDDYEYFGGKQTDITDEEIRSDIFDKVSSERKRSAFDSLAHKNIASEEVNDTLNNIERETGRTLTEEEKEYAVTRRMDAIAHGENVVEKAKEEFGANYVGELLDYLRDNAGTMSVDNRALIYISLENNLERQLLDKPKDRTLEKQLQLVRKESTAFSRSAAIATGYGVLRQIARVGYDLSAITESFFSDQQSEDRKKITKAVESTSEDINKEAELQEQEDYEGDIIVETPTGEKLKKARQEVAKAKDDFRKFLRKSGATLNSGANVAEFISQAAKLMTAYAKLGIVKVEDVLAEMRKDYGDKFVDENKENLRKAYMATVKTSSAIQDTVKQALIDKGYGRTITVTTANGKEQRQVLDWKKLAGAEGSIERMKETVEQQLTEDGYSKKEIEAIQQELTDEYNRLHASIIEKAIKELERRNKDKQPYVTKNSAQRLAEFYNLGGFDKSSNEYDNLMNSVLGLNQLERDAFIEAKEIAKAMATVYEFRTSDGRRLNDQTVKKAIADLQSQQEKLLTKVSNANSTKLYKLVDLVGEFISLGQRFVLAKLGQLIENPLAGYTERSMLDIGDRATKAGDTKELRTQRGKLAKAQFVDIVMNAGNDFGNVGSPFLIKSKLMDKFADISDAKAYHLFTSIFLGRAYLEGADSMHKIALTQRAFTNNLIKVLVAKGVDKQTAITQVSEALTGQSFEDAMQTAQELIEAVNTQAGKEMIPNNKQSVTLLANDIVKNALIEQGLVNDHELRTSFRSAYTVAGLGMGHEPNNFISRGIKNVNQDVQKKLQQAIKNKEWGEASWYKMENIIFNNILNPFVGGGTNWTVLTATKMGINPMGYINMLRKGVKIDPTTLAGQKALQENLTKSASRKNETIRTLNGALIGLSLYALTKATDDDDDLQKWLTKNKWAQPYFNKVSPPALGLLLASQAKTDGEEKAYNEWLGSTFNIKNVDYFDDSKKIVKAFQLLNPKSQSEYNDAMGALGQLTLGKINSPVPSWGIVKQVDNIIRGLNGQPPVASDFKATGYWNGALQGGLVEYLGMRPKGEVSMYDEKLGKEKNLKGAERKRYEDMLALITEEHIEAKEKDLAKLPPASRLSEIKKITTKAEKEVKELLTGYSDSIKQIEQGNVTYELTKEQIRDRMQFAKEFKERNPNLLTVIENNNRVQGEITAETRIKARAEYRKEMNEYTRDSMLEKDIRERSEGREYLKEK